jgi:hypothetical protein
MGITVLCNILPQRSFPSITADADRNVWRRALIGRTPEHYAQAQESNEHQVENPPAHHP